MHSDGKMPDVKVEKAEKWLRVRSKSDERALRALPGKAARISRSSRQSVSRGRAGLALKVKGCFRGGVALGERNPTTAGRRLLIGEEFIGLWTYA